MQWFRMWADAVDDEKLKLLAFEDRWHFVAILCLKRKGVIDAPDTPALRDRKVGAKLGLGDRDRDEVRNRLREVGLIDETWQPLAWGKRQFVSDVDPTALERKRRERERKRHAPVTRDIRDSHGPVTDESRRSDTETDSEKNSVRAAKPPTDGTDADQIWSLGVQILGASSRSLLGRMVKQHGREKVAAKIGELSAMAPRPVDPKSWLVGVLKPREERPARFRTA